VKTPDEASQPIAEEMLFRPKRFKPKERDKFEGFRDRQDDEDWVPEPPKY
jgi:hypothetical protein